MEGKYESPKKQVRFKEPVIESNLTICVPEARNRDQEQEAEEGAHTEESDEDDRFEAKRNAKVYEETPNALEREVRQDYEARVMEEKATGKRYLVLRDGKRFILCLRSENRLNAKYTPIWWALRVKGEIARQKAPGPNYRLWIIEDLNDWRTVEIVGKVLNEKWKMEPEVDTKVYSIINHQA